MNKIELGEFYSNLYQESFVGFDADTDASKSDVFRRMIGEYLEEDGDLSDIIWAEYNQRDMEISGYSFDKERGLLTVIGDYFFQNEQIQTLTKDLYERTFKRLKAFFIEATDPSKELYKTIAPGDPVAGVAKFFLNCKRDNSIRRVVFLLLTNGVLTRNTATIPSETITGIHCDYQVYDIKYVYQSVMEEQGVTVSVDLKEYGCQNGLSCIKAISDNEKDYESYLVVVPGIVLAQIYDKYGQKLLEQNVRTFLQLRGKTNKNMLATIKSQPERFFIYNNGLTCTASSVVIDVSDESSRIKSLEGLQIVNGGQTSSVIYKAYCEGIDLSKVFVQMKLSVIHAVDSYDDLVGYIARYANTQNPVKDADFFSSNPFNKQFFDVSSQTWTPIVGGRQYSTIWFYERTRGLYLNEKSRYERSGKGKEFIRKFPKEQFIDKNILAKAEMIFSDKPHASVKSNIAFPQFSSYVAKLMEGNFAVTPDYVKKTIGRIILINETDKLIASNEWAKGMRSIRAHIKAYSLALLDKYVKDKGRQLNYMDIWDRQNISDELSNAVLICVNAIHFAITKYPDITDLREKLGKAYTWEELKTTSITVPDSLLNSICITAQQQAQQKKEEKKDISLMSQTNKQADIYLLKPVDWQKLYSFLEGNPGLCTAPNALGLVDRMARKIFYTSKKSEIDSLYEAMCIGKEHGIIK